MASNDLVHLCDDEAIGRELDEAQRNYLAVTGEATVRRQSAVASALAAVPPWSRYKIAARLGVHPNTVRAIQVSIERAKS